MTRLIIPVFLTMLVMAACSQEPVDYEQLTVAELRNLAEQGHVGAQKRLGVAYRYGQEVAKDLTESHRLFRLAAEQGDVIAQVNLGFSYRHGEGVSQDYAESVKWYRAAAEQGYTNAQLELGFSYREGRGVPQDDVQAQKWFNLGFHSGELAKEMTREQVAEAQRLATEWEPKEWEVIRQELGIGPSEVPQ